MIQDKKKFLWSLITKRIYQPQRFEAVTGRQLIFNHQFWNSNSKYTFKMFILILATVFRDSAKEIAKEGIKMTKQGDSEK